MTSSHTHVSDRCIAQMFCAIAFLATILICCFVVEEASVDRKPMECYRYADSMLC